MGVAPRATRRVETLVSPIGERVRPDHGKRPIVVVSGDYDVACGRKTSGLVEAVVRKPIDINRSR